MDKKKIGISLRTKREALGITHQDMGKKIGCDRTTVFRMENGTCAIRKTKILAIARGYEIEPQELADLCGLTIDGVSHFSPDDLEVTATVEDFEFLITVARGLQRPMNISLIRELLKSRKSISG